jgi:hypothetical protein
MAMRASSTAANWLHNETKLPAIDAAGFIEGANSSANQTSRSARGVGGTLRAKHSPS